MFFDDWSTIELNTKPARRRERAADRFYDINRDFRCIHCGNLVSTLPALAGVQNRNHCPYCLWSRHLDLEIAGDRLAACKAGMRPVGLTLKLAHKRYGSESQGELMLVHECSECGRVSINRIAADDDPEGILKVFESSPERQSGPALADVRLLRAEDLNLVRARLFGRQN